ncbi:MAG: hypothetical protein AB1746_13795 [Candidatus Zixiibacteriota bacterium]
MKKLIIFIIFLALAGCSSDKKITQVENPTSVLGNWNGSAELIYPGPDDAPIYDTAVILELTLNEDGYYSLVGTESFPIGPMPIVVADYYGTYSIINDSIEFIPYLTDRPPKEPYYLEGKYGYALFHAELVFKQILNPDSWPQTQTIRLTPNINIFTIFGQ